MNATTAGAWRIRFYGHPDTSWLERTTLHRFLAGMVFQGVWWAGYLLFPFVLAKSLDAPRWLVTLAVTLETSGMVLALWWGHLMCHVDRRRVLVWGGLAGRGVLLLMPLVHTSGAFVLVLVVVYVFAALIYPAQNGIFQANFRNALQGRFFGYGTMIQNLVAAGVSIVVGMILDRDPGAFRIVYPVIGALGLLYPLALARLPRPEDLPDELVPPAARVPAVRPLPVPGLPLGRFGATRLLRSLGAPFREAVATFRADRPFLWFEINFMIYGLAFMMLSPVIPLFFIEELHLAYTQISSARVLIASLGVALLGPLVGRSMDRYHPVRVCLVAYALMALQPLTLALAGLMPAVSPVVFAYAAFGLYSMGMAGVNLTWNVGSIAFAPRGRGGHYQGVHVAMVGLRGLVGPLVGYAVLSLFGYRQVFLLAAAFFLMASLSSRQLWRWLESRIDRTDPSSAPEEMNP